MRLFKGDTGDQVWRLAAKELLSKDAHIQNSRLGGTKELLHVCYQINNPRERWVTSRKPSINPAFAIAEVFWILAGSNDASFINHWNPGLPKYAGNSEKYHGAYGYRFRNHFGFDQLERAYFALNGNKDSRQIVLQIWDPKIDFPDLIGRPVSPDIPCNINTIPKIRSGKLEWLQIMRSNDLFRGMPYNIIQFTILQEILAGWLGVELGAYSHVSDSLHFYMADLNNFNLSDEVCNLKNTDNLVLNKNASDEVVSEVYSILARLKQPTIAETAFMEMCSGSNLPQAYRNLLAIAAADSARRHGWGREYIEQIVSQCTNRQLIYVWDCWNEKFQTNIVNASGGDDNVVLE